MSISSENHKKIVKKAKLNEMKSAELDGYSPHKSHSLSKLITKGKGTEKASITDSAKNELKTKVRRKLTSQKPSKINQRIISDDDEPNSFKSRMERYSRRKSSGVQSEGGHAERVLSNVTSPKISPKIYESILPENSDIEPEVMERAIALVYGAGGPPQNRNMYKILKQKLHNLEIKWGLKSEGGLPLPVVNAPYNEMTSATANFNINWGSGSMDKLKGEYIKCINEIKDLRLEFDSQGIGKLDNLFLEGVVSLQKMIQICENQYMLALSIMKNHVLKRPHDNIEPCDKKFLKPFISVEGLNNKQKLLYTLLGELALHEYRRNSDKCYREIITDDGYKTQSYKEVCSIRQFIISKCDRITDPENWKILTSSKTEATIVDLERSLITTDDVDFPPMILDRHKFSFINGIFTTRNKRYTENGKLEYYCKFYPYDSPNFYEINKKITSAKYYDLHFEDYDCPDWYDIPTPNIQSILEYQYQDHPEYEEISRTIYALIGRMLFDRGDLDNWQVMPYIQGMAGSGKSTISGFVLKEFYHGEQIAELDNKMERQFGLGPLCDPDGPKKFITIGDELDKNCQLDLTHLLKMVSGDEIAAARKNRDPIYLKWPHHMWFSGNEIPGWQNKQGALTRRIINIVFEKKVRAKDRDPNLGDRIKREIPAIMLKCVRAYLELSNKYSSRDFWSFCPGYFKETQSQLANLTNVLRNFLECEELVYDEAYHVSEHHFHERLLSYALSQNEQVNLRNKHMVYTGMIQEINEERGANLKYVKVAQVMYGGKLHRNCYFFQGIRWADDSTGEINPNAVLAPKETVELENEIIGNYDDEEYGEEPVNLIDDEDNEDNNFTDEIVVMDNDSRENSTKSSTKKKLKIKKKSSILKSIEVEDDMTIGDDVDENEKTIREKSFRDCNVVIDGTRVLTNKSNPFN